MKKHVKWYSAATIYVDIHTGQTLTKHQAKTNYKKLKTDTYYEINENGTIGTRQCTIQCEHKYRNSLFGENRAD